MNQQLFFSFLTGVSVERLLKIYWLSVIAPNPDLSFFVSAGLFGVTVSATVGLIACMKGGA